MRARRLASVLALLAAARGGPAAATVADDVCAGDPCVLSRGIEVTPGSVLDFGARAFRVAPNGRLSTGQGDTLTIRARSVTLQPGGLIRGPLLPTTGITVVVEASEDVVLQRSGATRARIEAQGRTSGGSIEVTAGGDVDLAGDLRAEGTTADGSGGSVTIQAATLTMSGVVNASGGLAGSGGAVAVTTAGALVAGAIDASGGSDGGSIALASGGSLTTTGVLDARGRAAEGLGGDVTLDAEGGVTVGALVTVQGTGSLVGGGLGGEVGITAGAGVLLNGPIDTSAGGPDGEGGLVAIEAGADLTQTQRLSAHGPGAAAGGGEIDLVAGGVLRLDARVEVQGALAGGVTAQGGAEVRVAGEIDADGDRGSIDVASLSLAGPPRPGTVVVTGNLHARGPSEAAGGAVSLQGCDVTLPAAGRLVTAGSGARNLVRASGQLTIAGAVLAGPAGGNRFEYRDAARPPALVPGAVVQPAAVSQVELGLPACAPPVPAVCGNGMTESGETCDDGGTASCDGCSAVCRLEACGNAMVECAEECDDGNVLDGDGCDANCTTTGCGNGRVTPGEECDDGNTAAGDGCAPDCRIEPPPGCGDGTTDPGEECDDRNTIDCDGCSRTCLRERCGNNRVECAEACDAGNQLDCDGDGCAATCLQTEACGDGTVQCEEQCDAGPQNSRPGVGCNALCRLCALGTGDCPCGSDSDCHQLGRCAGLACAPDGLCVSVERPQCDDGNVCNGLEACADGACVVGTPPLQCADADACTVDSCDRERGCLHAPATGLPAVSCRVETLRRALDGADTGEVPAKLRRRLEAAAARLEAAVDAIAGAGGDARRQRRLLKRAERGARKLLRLVAKGIRTGRLAPELGETLRAAADGAVTAAIGLRRGTGT